MKYFGSQEICHQNLLPPHGALQQCGNFFHNKQFYNRIPDTLPTQTLSIVVPQSMSQGPMTGCVPMTFSGQEKKICVGDSQSIILTVQNLHNMQFFYQVSYVSAFINNESVSIEMAGVHFPSMLPHNAGSTTDIQITLTPKYEGKIIVTLQIVACFNPSELTTINVGNSSLKTKIQYESLKPSISISSHGKQNLDFGTIIAGSCITEFIKITNKCEAVVPLCVNLSGDFKDNHISFGLNQMKHLNFPASTGLKILSPKAILCRLSCSKSESATSSLELPLLFEAGNNNCDVNFTVTAAIQTTTFNEPLEFLRVSATVGKAELVLTDVTQNRLLLCTEMESVCHRNATVKNQCSFPVVYDLMIVEDDTSSFSVSPASLDLQPLQTSTVTISFTPNSTLVVKSNLQAAAQPNGKEFTLIELIGNGKPSVSDARYSRNFPSNVSKQISKEAKPISRNSSIIECNKKYLYWGGIDIGNTAIKNFCLRNCSNKNLQAKLFIKEKSQRTFKLLDDKNEQLTTLVLDLTSYEQKNINVAFAPTRVAPSSGFLAIKPIMENEQKIFSMPLAGYGGTGKLKVAEIYEKEGVGHCWDVIVSKERKTTFSNLRIQNTGLRPVFVKIVVSGTSSHSSMEVVAINPSEFVLLENEQKVLIVSCTTENFSTLNITDNGIITILYGDEIIRQQMRRSIGENSRYSQTPMFHGINFDVPFAGEERVPYDSTYISKVNIFSLFTSTMKKYLIHLNITEPDANFSQMTFGALSLLDNTCSSTIANTPMIRRLTAGPGCDFSPPVREFTVDTLNRLSMPSSPTFLCEARSLFGPKIDENVREKDSSGHWTVKPELLTIDANSKDNRILLINFSNQDLRFKIECAIEIISVSPVSGIVSANGQIGLRISIIPYPYSKLIDDYKGYIKVLCDDSEKNVLIKVLKSQKRVKDLLIASENNVTLEEFKGNLKNMVEESIADKTVINSTSIFIKNICEFPKEIILNSTSPGKISETVLTVQNGEKHSVKWNINPFSMLFTEAMDDFLNANVLQIQPSSGVLQAMEKANITIKFTPSNPDSFFQFFQLTLNFFNGQNQKCSFKIRGSSICLTENTEINKSSAIAHCSKKADVYVENEVYEFPNTTPGQINNVFITVKNSSLQDIKLSIVKPQLPFIINQSSIIVRSKKFLKFPVYFKPAKCGKVYEDVIMLQSENGHEFVIQLKGFCN
ncbi:centrosomal protein [Caerostris extrusa]|uniref:Centrosomal protein n=1 Tax=Caerostris extrusa TaxID=172846 RepID=A0AAV4WX22_CAEEX|nr:centrosomal protein [Caerostris extrusa]